MSNNGMVHVTIYLRNGSTFDARCQARGYAFKALFNSMILLLKKKNVVIEKSDYTRIRYFADDEEYRGEDNIPDAKEIKVQPVYKNQTFKLNEVDIPPEKKVIIETRNASIQTVSNIKDAGSQTDSKRQNTDSNYLFKLNFTIKSEERLAYDFYYDESEEDDFDNPINVFSPILKNNDYLDVAVLKRDSFCDDDSISTICNEFNLKKPTNNDFYDFFSGNAEIALSTLL
jgi:hypothetical protein